MELKLKNGSALIIVAHPDDETIWMGGLILKFPKIKWTIFSLCRADDKDRAPKFKKVCRFYGAKTIISNLEDEERLNFKESLPEIKRRITNKIGTKKFDYVFTHGYNGEYGHPRHRGIHLIVRQMILENKLRARRLFCFNYKFSDTKNFCISQKTAIFTKLNAKTIKTKREIIEKIYGYGKPSFEYKSCSNVEFFKSIKIASNKK